MMLVLFSLLWSKCLVNREEMLELVGIAWVVEVSKISHDYGVMSIRIIFAIWKWVLFDKNQLK